MSPDGKKTEERTMRAYYKNEDNGGTLEMTTVAVVGNEIFSKVGAPLSATGEKVDLVGWPDTKADVYKTQLGDVFYIPAK